MVLPTNLPLRRMGDNGRCVNEIELTATQHYSMSPFRPGPAIAAWVIFGILLSIGIALAVAFRHSLTYAEESPH